MSQILKFMEGNIEGKLSFKPEKEQIIIGEIPPLINQKIIDYLQAALNSVSKRKDVGKVYVTLPVEKAFLAEIVGFKQEVFYPNAFSSISEPGHTDAVDMVYFLHDDRRIRDDERDTIYTNLKKILQTPELPVSRINQLKQQGYSIRTGTIDDAIQIANVWNAVFLCNDDYPNGLTSDETKETFEDKNQSWVICEKQEEIVGIGSVYLDESPQMLDYIPKMKEIADCVVLPEHSQKGIMTEIVRLLTKSVFRNSYVDYAYCCAESEGIHKVMASLGYIPTGISEHTNHLLLAGDGIKKPENIMDVPYVNNIVWFNTG